VVKKLWDSWEDESVLADKTSGIFADSAKVHPIDHVGLYFSVQGPLTAVRPLQGHPVIIQYDQSELGLKLAARTADVFVALCSTAGEAIRVREKLHSLLDAEKRPRHEIKFLLSVFTVLGGTDVEAQQRLDKLNELSVEGLNATLRKFPPRHRWGMPFTGTANQLNTFMDEWTMAGLCDGFNIMPAVLPDGIDALFSVLRHRRRCAHTATLRSRFGLERPVSASAPRRSHTPSGGEPMNPRARMHLGLFIYPGGHHIAGWRHPEAPANSCTTIAYYRTVAQLAERGKFDLFFVGDTLATRNKGRTFFGRQAIPNLDPVTLCSAVSSVTTKLGVVATLSTTYHEPAYVATKFATLDHISGGRAGWNIVTTFDPAAAFNFGRAGLVEKQVRYERGKHFVETVTALWDSWDDEALIANKRTGQLVDVSLITATQSFDDVSRTAKPFRLPRSPQGWPVLIQAGGSPHGRDLAARYAEVIFTAQPDIEEARLFRADMHARMAAFERMPSELAILPGLSPILASTESKARRKEADLDELVDPEVAMWMLAKSFPFDFSRFDPTDPLAVEALPKSTANNATLLSTARRSNMSVLHAAKWLVRSRSHHTFVGTPEKLADVMQRWLQEGACDGFNIMPPVFPESLETFVDHVVPELQKRGLFRQEYEGTTLRTHLGLKVPQRHQKVRAA